MPEASSLRWMEMMPGQTDPASHYLRNMFRPHHVMNRWGLSVYSRPPLLPGSEVRVPMLSLKWHRCFQDVFCREERAAGFLSSFHSSGKAPDRIRSREQHSTCYFILDRTLDHFFLMPHLDVWVAWMCLIACWRKKMGVKPAEGTHPLGIPQKQFISPQKMWSRRIKYLCLFAAVIKLYSIMSQAQPNGCWKLGNNPQTHKKYRINNARRKLWENSL